MAIKGRIFIVVIILGIIVIVDVASCRCGLKHTSDSGCGCCGHGTFLTFLVIGTRWCFQWSFLFVLITARCLAGVLIIILFIVEYMILIIVLFLRRIRIRIKHTTGRGRLSIGNHFVVFHGPRHDGFFFQIG